MALNTIDDQSPRLFEGDLSAPPELHGWLGAAVRIFKFFASLKLAIFILISLMVIMATGTIIESKHGMDASRLLVYETVWFHAILFLLGVNVLAAALDRLPWKKKHTGFVITHLGILIILTGSFITHNGMIDGQIAIAEGESEHRLTLSSPLIYLYSAGLKSDWIMPLRKRPFAWTGREPLRNPEGALPLEISALRHYPKAIGKTHLIETPEGGAPAVEITLHNSFVNQKVQLIENDPQFGRTQVGPATVSFAKEPLVVQAASVSQGPYLEFQFANRNIQLPVPANRALPAEFVLEGTPYRIKIFKTFRNAFVEGRELADRPAAKEETGPGENPAVQLELSGKDALEKHTVFSNYPDFPTQHGMQPSAAGVKILYRMPGGGSRNESHELRFFYDRAAKALKYQVQNGAALKEGAVKIGEEIETGWMDLKFRADRFYPSAAQRQEFTPLANTSEDPLAVPAVELELKSGDSRQALWLEQGVRRTVNFDGASYDVMFGQRRVPAGFKLELRDFKIDYYPGTQKPASFESDVTLKDSGRGIVKETTISMNKPLNYRGFHIYQSGYQLGEGAPEVSVFSVGRDPGIPWKYTGTIVMVLGISLMFYMKPYSMRAGQAV